MADPLVSFEQLQKRPGFELATEANTEGLRHDASGLVRLATRNALDDVDAPLPDGNPIVAVLVSMIRRGMQNPLGATQQSLGDYAVSMSAGSVYLTKREMRIVRQAAGTLGAGSLAMTSDMPKQISEEYES